MGHPHKPNSWGMKAAVIIAALLFATAAYAEPAAKPAGAVQFCLRNPSFCDTHPVTSAPRSAAVIIDHINQQVNRAILPEALNTDDEKRAENSNWRVVMPGGVGACVEYAITKMARLAGDGVPMGAMRLAQVRLPVSGELHMVLLVRVNGVLVVLDNLTPVIWGPEQTHYEFLAVQNGANWDTADGLK